MILYLIAASRKNHIPSHCFYADDLMVFCKGKVSSLEALKNLFARYAACSGQSMNLRKSFIYAGGITDHKLNHIVNMLGFTIGSLPFNYLGAPIFKGKPKCIHLQPIAGKVKAKLTKWKASLLSIAGRIQLVKYVVQSMLIHTMSIYSWPVKLLRDMEKWIKKIIWSGDVTKRKMVIVAWKKICADFEEGGLELKSLICLNEATNLKMCWNILQSEEQWANIVKSRVLRGNICINHHISSSIWSGAKAEFSILQENCSWIVGNGNQINFWSDSWCGQVLAQTYNLSDQMLDLLPKKLSSYIADHKWNISDEMHQNFPNLRFLVSQVTLPNGNQRDKLVWKHSPKGELTQKNAYSFKKHQKGNLVHLKLPHTQGSGRGPTIWCVVCNSPIFR